MIQNRFFIQRLMSDLLEQTRIHPTILEQELKTSLHHDGKDIHLFIGNEYDIFVTFRYEPLTITLRMNPYWETEPLYRSLYEHVVERATETLEAHGVNCFLEIEATSLFQSSIVHRARILPFWDGDVIPVGEKARNISALLDALPYSLSSSVDTNYLPETVPTYYNRSILPYLPNGTLRVFIGHKPISPSSEEDLLDEWKTTEEVIRFVQAEENIAATINEIKTAAEGFIRDTLPDDMKRNWVSSVRIKRVVENNRLQYAVMYLPGETDYVETLSDILPLVRKNMSLFIESKEAEKEIAHYILETDPTSSLLQQNAFSTKLYFGVFREKASLNCGVEFDNIPTLWVQSNDSFRRTPYVKIQSQDWKSLVEEAKIHLRKAIKTRRFENIFAPPESDASGS